MTQTSGPGDVAERKPRSNLASRVLAALVLAPLAIAAAYLGGWLYLIFWSAAGVAVLYEWIVLVSAGAGTLSRPQRAIWMIAGILYAAALVAAALILRSDPVFGGVAIALLFAVVWSTDIAGYFAGRAFGGPKLAPRISPKKTWSGALGGTVVAVIAAVAVETFARIGTIQSAAVLGLLLSICAQAGDLFESWIKRRFGAKDAGKLIPGHGGVMDRLDGFWAAVVVAAFIGIARGGLDAPARGLMLW